ncbi:Cleavage and polyadenylation specificity factor subunit, putative [Entamoeba dispar SAW760]|uniref:Cleavage and polyadenylation specificity factor subunit 5 n=1 Tax=Entamoeba dispar (strain ATCC PRA-260 / SAW760) TaxID=370354 RepID=B0EHD3_ENTDS|nr:Cleavage and polyadenylation specificity factor subunit, putative [Entamoeba dispar SAW760]EDR26062.1 Cleavage and polyadenylation specificity factor subunit, putative [Entamoeba dispar SAW760]|eukprot:EDR26062.1 Cleavage and polyadenylation specificity factor subunit, putative [Entamoeba dispar SAW760]
MEEQEKGTIETIQEEEIKKEEEIEKQEEEKKKKENEHRNYPPLLKIYPIENYQIDKKEKLDKLKQQTFGYQMEQLKISVEKNHVPRTSVYGVILVHKNNFPHLLVLQSNLSMNLKDEIHLVGGRLKIGEDDPVEGLKRKLRKKMSMEYITHYEIGELLGTFYRIGYDKNLYPYIPVHISQVKEIINIYMIHLVEKCDFKIFDTDKLSSIPLFALHNNFEKYNITLCSIPIMVSRYLMIYG